MTLLIGIQLVLRSHAASLAPFLLNSTVHPRRRGLYYIHVGIDDPDPEDVQAGGARREASDVDWFPYPSKW
jgi:hypothetical protein